MAPTILITGATAGLGRYLAADLAATGARLVLHGRDPQRLAAVRDELRAGGGRVDTVRADLAELRQVDRLADDVLAEHGRLDVLVNNAGIGGGAPGTGRELSADGLELRFAVNYLAGYHLTRRLLPALRAGAPARVVNVASVGQHPIDFDNVMLATGYDRQRGYAQSKLAQIMFTLDLAEEFPADVLTANALHPATFMDTAMVREGGVPVLSTVADGAAPTLRLITDPELAGVTGRYFNEHREARADPQAYDRDARARLRELSDRLVAEALAR